MKHLELLQTLESNLVKLDSERTKENAQILTQLTTTMQNYCESLKTNYTSVLNTNNATMKDYTKLIQATQETLKNSYLELETANKEHNKTMQMKLQELEKQIHKNLAKKSLLMPLTFIMGLVIMGAILVVAYFLIILPSKDKELELSQKEVFQLKREIDQLNNANLQRIYDQIPTKK
ncbi:molybdopterin-guanine dinucleotide biosynthesis protein MobB (plasmid) [Helicobacter pylori]|uniref:molybdopterin-guanine dinucleotide biosynthesis protein MobB n=1 Tax=Helicobacter pylori TaxID=210 RepID=UPI001FD345D8|nr:molybdopterin-guanine dinucleotide biosynthesis protein MobB [Helicobacter pylori]UOS13746.1 molybdopterin-guanine dinucleotide biosynthesis protein MobB [Helicobacter pylori]